MALKHFPWEYYMILCHAGPPWGLFRGLLGPNMAQNSTKMDLYGPKWPFMTLNDASMKSLHDPQCPCMTPNGHKTFLRGIIHDYITYWTTQGPFQRPTWPRGPLKRPQGGPIWHIIMYYASEECFMAIWGHAGTFWVMKALH